MVATSWCWWDAARASHRVPCSVLTTEQSPTWRLKRYFSFKLPRGNSFLLKSCRKFDSATFGILGGCCKVLLGLGITLLLDIIVRMRGLKTLVHDEMESWQFYVRFLQFFLIGSVIGGISGPTLISFPGSNVRRPGKLTPWASLPVTFSQVQERSSKERRAWREDSCNLNDLYLVI